MPGEGGHDHADEPQPELGPDEPQVGERPARQLWPKIIGDRKIHDDDRAAEDEVKVSGDKLRVVDGSVELVAHIDQSARAAEAQHHEGEG